MRTTSQIDDSRVSLLGQILVATPHIHSEPYRQAVVLVMQHGDRGAFGLALRHQFRSGLKSLSSFASAIPPRGGSVPSCTPDINLFSGALNWSPGRLESEIVKGVWMISPVRFEALGQSDNLWFDLVRAIGRSVLVDSIGQSAFQTDCSKN